MKNNDELLEQMIKQDFKRAAKEEDAALGKDDDISVPVGMKESLYLKISEEIERLEKSGKVEKEKEEKGEDVKKIDNIIEIGTVRKKKQDNLYANMSEEDLKALEIGRRVMEEEERAQREGKVVRKKKRVRKAYFGLAAAVVLAMAVGLTSMGGPERIISMMRRVVGNREIEQVDSSEDNLIIVNENEEEAYRRIGEEFGIEPVRIIIVTDNMKFVSMKYDELMRAAELSYEYAGEKLIYLINSSYLKESFGFEIEDKVLDKYSVEVCGKEIEIKQYQVAKGKTSRFSASFEERGLNYFLTGTMEKTEFELIVNNLYFLR